MWPVQTLTLLLCLTDEEQLFAQKTRMENEPDRTEQIAVPAEPVKEEEAAVVYPEA